MMRSTSGLTNDPPLADIAADAMRALARDVLM